MEDYLKDNLESLALEFYDKKVDAQKMLDEDSEFEIFCRECFYDATDSFVNFTHDLPY